MTAIPKSKTIIALCEILDDSYGGIFPNPCLLNIASFSTLEVAGKRNSLKLADEQ